MHDQDAVSSDLDSAGRTDYAAIAAFRKALRKFIHFAEAEARKSGVTPQQHQLLLAVRADPEREWASVREIADSLHLRHHATVGLVDRCQEAGLIRRAGDPNDRRVVRIFLTERGETILAEITARNLAELRGLGRITKDLEELQQES